MEMVMVRDLKEGSYYLSNEDSNIYGQLTKKTHAYTTGHNEYIFSLEFNGLKLDKNFEWGEKFTLIDKDKTDKLKNRTNKIGTNCYEAIVNDEGEYMCPYCDTVAGGTSKIINHNYNCPNRDKKYCQSIRLGGKRKSRQNKKRRNSKRKNSKRRNSRR